jgi:hypothetical protein
LHVNNGSTKGKERSCKPVGATCRQIDEHANVCNHKN